MNSIRQIQELNKQELKNGVSPDASWHTDYRDTAYIYIGGLPFDLSEGDIVTIFSQFGEPTYVNLVRDKETGKSKGFAFLKYEDQRSTDLAVDNLGGTMIMGRMLRVDHTRYKRKDDEIEEGQDVKVAAEGIRGGSQGESESNEESGSHMLIEERELAILMRDHDDDDPMKAFLIDEKREKILATQALLKGSKPPGKERRKRHRPSHRSKDDETREETYIPRRIGTEDRRDDYNRSHRPRGDDSREDSHRSQRNRERESGRDSRRRS